MERYKYIPSFGIRNGLRSKSGNKLRLLEELFKKYKYVGNEAILESKPLILEIGFGDGSNLFSQAVKYRGNHYIGAEVYLPGIVKLLSKLDIETLSNVSLYIGDARELLEEMKDDMLEKIYIFYPDPWPKRRQQKKRLLNSEFLSLLYRKMKAKGELYVATDDLSYKLYLTDLLNQEKQFNLIPCDNKGFEDLSDSKYQNKAREKGSKCYYFIISKKSF